MSSQSGVEAAEEEGVPPSADGGLASEVSLEVCNDVVMMSCVVLRSKRQCDVITLVAYCTRG